MCGVNVGLPHKGKQTNTQQHYTKTKNTTQIHNKLKKQYFLKTSYLLKPEREGKINIRTVNNENFVLRGCSGIAMWGFPQHKPRNQFHLLNNTYCTFETTAYENNYFFNKFWTYYFLYISFSGKTRKSSFFMFEGTIFKDRTAHTEVT